MSQTAPVADPLVRRWGLPGLLGKNVLVTGGTSGIGQAIGVRFAEHGANVAINYLTTAEEAAGTEERVVACLRKIHQNSVREVLVQGDVSSEDDVVRMVSERVSASAAWTSLSTTPASRSRDRPSSSPAPSSTMSSPSTCAARSCAPARRSSYSWPTRSPAWIPEARRSTSTARRMTSTTCTSSMRASSRPRARSTGADDDRQRAARRRPPP